MRAVGGRTVSRRLTHSQSRPATMTNKNSFFNMMRMTVAVRFCANETTEHVLHQSPSAQVPFRHSCTQAHDLRRRWARKKAKWVSDQPPSQPCASLRGASRLASFGQSISRSDSRIMTSDLSESRVVQGWCTCLPSGLTTAKEPQQMSQ